MITVRDLKIASAQSGTGRPLAVRAEAGDLVLLVTSSQFGHVGTGGVPSGWRASYSDGAHSSQRSGFLAFTRATRAGQVSVPRWWGLDSRYAARQCGMLLAIAGAATDAEPGLSTWSATAPTAPSSGLLLAQEHGSRWDGLDEFTLPRATVVAPGEASTTASWSTIRALLVSGGGTPSRGRSTATTVWATVSMKPAKAPVAVVGAGGAQTPGGRTVPAKPVTAGVDSLLSRSEPWIVAHRGGSAEWPEMSLRAYANSVAAGVPALEFSFSLTSDGVAVGVHDQTLQRIDPTAPPRAVSAMTWGEVQGFTTGGEPLISLDTLTQAFGKDHVLFVDPKYSVGSVDAYLSKLDPAQTIIKYYGDATWLARACRARGFRTWGYLYPAEILDGRAASWAQHWDLIGVPWDASEAVWQTARSYGKPILGHICPSQEALSRSLKNGAVGAVCSRITGMVTR